MVAEQLIRTEHGVDLIRTAGESLCKAFEAAGCGIAIYPFYDEVI